MAKILIVTTGLRGILNASIALAHELQQAGHLILLAAPRDRSLEAAREGLNFVELPAIVLRPALTVPDFTGPGARLRKLIYRYTHAAALRRKALEQMAPTAYAALLERETPELVLIDVELHEYIFTAHQKGINFVLLSQWFSLWRRPGLPYLLHTTIPGRGWTGSRLGLFFAWENVRWSRWWTFTKQRWRTAGLDRRSLVLSFAKASAFPRSYLRENNWPGPVTYGTLPVLSMTAQAMEFPHDARPNHHYLGPMVHPHRLEELTVSLGGTSVEAVLLQAQQSARKLLCCTVSTLSRADRQFLLKLILAVSERPDWILVMGTGGQLEREDVKVWPPNVFAFSYLPQIRFLRHADLSINHGGIHTINECIHFRVPMLVYSGKRSDQNGCAARVQYHGLGVMADKDQDSPLEIQQKIAAVLRDKSIRLRIEEKCKEIQSQMPGAVQIIEQYLPNQVPRPV